MDFLDQPPYRWTCTRFRHDLPEAQFRRWLIRREAPTLRLDCAALFIASTTSILITGVALFPKTFTVAPASVAVGITVTLTGRYR